MQVTFKKITYKNFLSTGASGTTIHLDSHLKTLIVGKNGGGKSTVIDALCFGLFGKAFRPINKPQLINSINKKACVVEIEFTIGNTEFRVIRGIKPNIFEIYEDGELITQSSEVKDYQVILEKQIVKMNYKTFTQIIILGSSSYVPFMKLSASARREVIDEILDINIFTGMSKILKEKIIESKDDLSTIESAIDILKNKGIAQDRLIKSLSESKKSIIESLQSKVEKSQQEIEIHTKNVEKILGDIEELQKLIIIQEEINDKVQKGKIGIASRKDSISNDTKTITFFETHDTCNVCSQQISKSHKDNIVSSINANIQKNKSQLEQLEAGVAKAQERLNQFVQINRDIQSKNIEMSSSNSAISVLNRTIQDALKEIQSNSEDSANIDQEKALLKEVIVETQGKVKEKAQISEQRRIQDVCTQLLKDSGVKTAVIREFLPAINQLINKHLSTMEFFVKFELDENFDEVIKSRHRDEFSYASFSEGEKFRIDMAIMSTWWEIARMKNSINTNILFFDEVIDGVLDESGIEYFFEFINTLKECNVFVISHKVDQVLDKFDRVLKFEKNKDFSNMVEL